MLRRFDWLIAAAKKVSEKWLPISGSSPSLPQ
jgi:hypothetical protein